MSSSKFIARFVVMVIALGMFSFAPNVRAQVPAGHDVLAVGKNKTTAATEIWSVNSTTGDKKLMKTFTAGTGMLGAGGWEPESSFLDPFTGKLTIQHGDGTQTIYDPADDTLTTRSTSRGIGLLSDNSTDTLFQRVYDTVDGGVDSLILETTDSDGKSSTTLGTGSILSGGKTLLDQNATTGTTTIGDGSSAITVTDTGISKGGANLIGKTDDGAIHIGENSLVTVERDGQQLLYATDGAGNVIPINVANGSDLLVNGVNVGTSLATNTADIADNKADIATNVTNIATNVTNIATNTTNISTNTTNIASNYGLIGLNTTNIATNQVAILTNAAAIGLNTMQIAGNAADIAINRDDIATNASGVASAMAMAQLSEAGPGEKLVLSIGGGNWEGSTALAAGLSGRINQKFSVRGSASLASGNAGFSAGIGWRLK